MREDWSPSLYLRSEEERTRPAADLLARVPLAAPATVVDIGCGPGNSTELLARRFPNATVTGVDTSPDMLAAAAKRLPAARFVAGDVATWAPETPADLIYGNAVLQWLPDHAALFPALMDRLAPGGVLAVQLPDNLAEPSHTAMAEIAADGSWRAALASAEGARATILPAGGYYDLLSPHATRIDIWRTTYTHPLPDAVAIGEWFRSTGLKPYLDPLSDANRTAFLQRYVARMREAYPARADGKVLLSFPRLFIVAVRR